MRVRVSRYLHGILMVVGCLSLSFNPLLPPSLWAQVAPFSKSGGLADVADKLGVALSKMGHKVLDPN
jgi:hypothetical protein